jgi:hypothetical protein
MKFAIAVIQQPDNSFKILSASTDIGEVLAAYRSCEVPGKLFFSDKIQWDRSKRIAVKPEAVSDDVKPKAKKK